MMIFGDPGVFIEFIHHIGQTASPRLGAGKTTLIPNSTCLVIRRMPRQRKGANIPFWVMYLHAQSTYFRYSPRDEPSFAEQARNATFDLAGDEVVVGCRRIQLNRDKKIEAQNLKLGERELAGEMPISTSWMLGCAGKQK